MSDPAALLEEASKAISASSDEKSLEALRVQYLGKKGSLTALLKTLGTLPAEERPAAGGRINQAKQEIQQAIESRQRELIEAACNLSSNQKK